MRLLALAIAALALLAWLNVRDLLRRASYEQVTDPADDVQPPDPVTVAQYVAPPETPYRRYEVSPSGRVTSYFKPLGYSTQTGAWDPTDNLEPLTAADRSYIEATTLAAIRRSAQSSEAPTGGM